MPSISSEQIRRGLTTLQTILTYGVDGIAEQLKRTATIAELGLNPDVFFEELYISRPAHELDLLTQLRAAPLHTIAIAPIGWGKSTLLHFVLRQYSKETGTPIIIIDFRAIQKSFTGVEDLTAFISKEIKKQLHIDLSKRLSANGTITQQSELDALLAIDEATIAAPRETLSVGAFDCVVALQALFQFNAASSRANTLVEWLREVRVQDNHPMKEKVLEIMLKMQQGRDHNDLLAAYRQVVSPDRPVAKIVVAIDNMDQMADFRNLEYLDSWMKHAVSQSSLFQIVACIRPENQKLLTKPTHSGIFAEDADHIRKLPLINTDLDPAVKAEWERLTAEQDTATEIEGVDLDALSPRELERLAFEDMIHIRRLDFAERAVKTGNVGGVVTGDLRAVSAAAREIHRIQSISLDMTGMANGNLRVKWAGVANYLEYIAVLLELEWADIGRAAERRSSDSGSPGRSRVSNRNRAFRSLYYRFLGTGPDLGGQVPVFDSRVFDPVRCVLDCGWDGRKLLATEAEKVGEACSTLLVNIAIFNACGNTRRVQREEVVTLRSVVDICKELGLEQRTVLRVIHESIRSVEHRFSGMFHIDNYVVIRDKIRDADLDDRISSTQRLHRVLSLSAFTFGYLCQRLVENGVADVDLLNAPEAKRLAHLGLVPAEVVFELPYWLAKAMTVEAQWVDLLQKADRPNHRLTSETFQRYLDLFAIRDTHGSEPMVFTQGIARSCAAFLRIALSTIDQEAERDLFEAYSTAGRQLEHLDKQLREAVRKSNRGECWSIPRDMAIDIGMV